MCLYGVLWACMCSCTMKTKYRRVRSSGAVVRPVLVCCCRGRAIQFRYTEIFNLNIHGLFRAFMFFWCCCPFLPFLCVVGCCVALYAVAMLFWYAVVGRWRCPVVCLPWVLSAVGACSGMVLLCQPRYHVHYVNQQTIWSGSAQIFTGFSPPEPEAAKNTGQVKISARICSKSRLFLISHICVRGKLKNFSGNDRLSDRCTHITHIPYI